MHCRRRLKEWDLTFNYSRQPLFFGFHQSNEDTSSMQSQTQTRGEYSWFICPLETSFLNKHHCNNISLLLSSCWRLHKNIKVGGVIWHRLFGSLIGGIQNTELSFAFKGEASRIMDIVVILNVKSVGFTRNKRNLEKGNNKWRFSDNIRFRKSATLKPIWEIHYYSNCFQL